MTHTIVQALASAVAADPGRPLLTYYDDATGERTELSGTTLDNWVAKTANLLVDGHGLGAGDTATVLLPPHWQTAAVLLGCWAAGLGVQLDGGMADVDFVTPDRLEDTEAPAVYVLGLAPMAQPMRPSPPTGVGEFVVAVRGYGDRFAGPPVGPDTVALWNATAVTHAQLCRLAVDRAAAGSLGAGDRVLVDASDPDPVRWLLGPLVAGASIVLCRTLDPARRSDRIATERITRDWTRA